MASFESAAEKDIAGITVFLVNRPKEVGLTEETLFSFFPEGA
jgi:hypothetical protein